MCSWQLYSLPVSQIFLSLMLVVSNLLFVNSPPPQYKHQVLCAYFITLCACANSSFDSSFFYVYGDHTSARCPYEMVTLKIGCIL